MDEWEDDRTVTNLLAGLSTRPLRALVAQMESAHHSTAWLQQRHTDRIEKKRRREGKERKVREEGVRRRENEAITRQGVFGIKTSADKKVISVYDLQKDVRT